MKKSFLLLLTLVAVFCPLLSGCGQQGTTSTMSKDEESHFKGGSMPPEAQKAIAEQMKSGGGPGGPNSAAPGPAPTKP
jgi:hypothetical protein